MNYSASFQPSRILLTQQLFIEGTGVAELCFFFRFLFLFRSIHKYYWTDDRSSGGACTFKTMSACIIDNFRMCALHTYIEWQTYHRQKKWNIRGAKRKPTAETKAMQIDFWMMHHRFNVIISCCTMYIVHPCSVFSLHMTTAIWHCLHLQLWRFHILVACSTACSNCNNTQRSVCHTNTSMPTMGFETRINTILTSGSRNHDLNLLSGAHRCHSQTLEHTHTATCL